MICTPKIEQFLEERVYISTLRIYISSQAFYQIDRFIKYEKKVLGNFIGI